MSMFEVIRSVLHKRNYEERLQWNETEIDNLAKVLVVALSKTPSELEVNDAVGKAVHTRKDWQRRQLPLKSKEWFERLT
jgi:hypothetical protein